MKDREISGFNIGFAMLLPAIVVLFLAILKFAGYLNWSWWLVLAPVWLIWIAVFVILLALIVYTELFYKSEAGSSEALLFRMKRFQKLLDSFRRSSLGNR